MGKFSWRPQVLASSSDWRFCTVWRPCVGRADGRRAPGDVHQGHRADPAAKLPATAIGPTRSRRCRSSPTSRRGPYARAMKQRTALARSQYGRGAMPPWFLEKNIGIQKFKDDISLS